MARRFRGRGHAVLTVVGLVAAAVVLVPATPAAAVGPCDPPAQASIACENSKPGNPASEWDVSGSGSSAIQGFSTDISYLPGATVVFKVKTPARDYRLDVYRMGYYAGKGARKVATVQPSATLPQTQPGCKNVTTTGLIDCGNWKTSAQWAIPSTAVSGIYFAKLVREDGTSGASHIVFVVRNDTSHSDLLFQTSDTTWQAYNRYGGNSLYKGKPAGRAYKVSYNRPLTTRGETPQDAVFNAEYPMVRFLEANGYDVSYTSGIDTDRRGAELLEHKAFLSVGHDEYWSAGQRANVEAARDAGVHLAFFSGNEVFWKTRWESSATTPTTAYRTLVSYKESKANAKIDPNPAWTGTWRDARFSPPSDGGRPENALLGTIFTVNGPRADAIAVPADDGRMRLWRDTSVATLAPGQVATFAAGTLGYEWDEDLDNGFRPPGLVRMSTATYDVPARLLDTCCTFAAGTATHHVTLYRHPSGALVFGAGTVQWSWGLDSSHDRGSAPADPRMQQATVNLLADMGVQPATLIPGLVPASASTDVDAPVADVTSPASGTTVPVGAPVTVTGTATDLGGGEVGGVEVSVDGGTTWHPATGRSAWTYAWTPAVSGTVTINARAVDDSANLGAASAGTVVQVGSDTTPPSVTDRSPAPGATGVDRAGNLTVTFSEPIQPGSLSFTLRDAADSPVAGTTTLDAGATTATFDPSAALAGSSTYTATVSGATDASGNPMTTPDSWSFTTVPSACPCSIWAASSTPGVASSTDTSAVELGVKFRSDVPGTITGVRFYKGAANTGTHVGSLWTSTGTLLAQATFTDESASGWQQVTFSSPVAIAAGTTYIASYHTDVGGYAEDVSYFASAGVDVPPLHALKTGVDGYNGVYAYSAAPTFPANGSLKSRNYWVDVVFQD